MPVKYSRLTPDKIATIIKLRNNGKSYNFIANELNINKSSAHRAFHKYNPKSNNPKSKFSKSNFKHLSLDERKEIEILHSAGFSYSYIASKLSRSKSCIYYEITRNKRINDNSYSHQLAQKKYINRRAINSSKFFEPFISYFKANAEAHQSIYHIITLYSKAYPLANTPCRQTVYKWFKEGKIWYPNNSRGIRKYHIHYNNIQNSNIKSIHSRNFMLDDYSQFGNFEIDLVVPCQPYTKSILTFNERSSSKLYATFVDNKQAVTINKALRKIITHIGKHNIKTITSDNGKEFMYSEVIEKCYDLKWYYADPYASWQRGQNERLNRDLRLFFKKGTHFEDITEHQLRVAVDKINMLPRMKFNDNNAYHMYEINLIT